MPPFKTHLETSLKRTGNEYTALQDWLDNDPDNKAERHNLNILPQTLNT